MVYPSYQAQSDLLPLSDAELAELDATLAALPRDAALTAEALEGYLCGLLLAPRPLDSLAGATWLPLVWGGEPDPFPSGKQRKRVVLWVLRHLRALDEYLHHQPDRWEPIFSVAETAQGEWVDARDWCTGFMLAVDLDPDGWAPRFEAANWAEPLAAMALLGGAEELQDPAALRKLDDLEVLDGLSRAVPDAVLALARAHGATPA